MRTRLRLSLKLNDVVEAMTCLNSLNSESCIALRARCSGSPHLALHFVNTFCRRSCSAAFLFGRAVRGGASVDLLLSPLPFTVLDLSAVQPSLSPTL